VQFPAESVDRDVDYRRVELDGDGSDQDDPGKLQHGGVEAIRLGALGHRGCHPAASVKRLLDTLSPSRQTL
jgi:hypothetical protein